MYVAGSFTSPAASFGTSTLTNPYPNTSINNTTLGFLATLTDPTTTAAAGPREPAAFFPNPARRTATLRLPAGLYLLRGASPALRLAVE